MGVGNATDIRLPVKPEPEALSDAELTVAVIFLIIAFVYIRIIVMKCGMFNTFVNHKELKSKMKINNKSKEDIDNKDVCTMIYLAYGQNVTV